MSATPDFFTKLREDREDQLITSLRDPSNWVPLEDKNTYLFKDPLQLLSSKHNPVTMDKMISVFCDKFGRELTAWQPIRYNNNELNHMFIFSSKIIKI